MNLDFIRKNITLVIQSLLPALSPYARFAGEVTGQNVDLTLDVKLDSPTMPGMTGLKIKHGLPGVKVTVAAGARVLVGFEEGNRTKPFVELWESGSVTKLEIDATSIVLNGGTKKIAREDDPVNGGTITALGVPVAAPILFIYTPAGGVPQPASATLALTGGKITTGAPGVKA